MIQDREILLWVFIVIGIFLGINYVIMFREPKKVDDSLVVAMGSEYPPYLFYSFDAGKKYEEGFNYEFFALIAQKLHKPLKIKYLPFRDVIPGLKAGTIDLCGAGTSMTDERLHDLAMIKTYGGPTSAITMVFWDSSLYKQLSSVNQEEVPVAKAKAVLKDASIGVLSGSVWESILKEYGFKNIICYEYESEVFFALKRDKVSAIITSEFAAKNLKKRYPDIRMLDIKLDRPWSHGAGIAIKKERIDLIEKVSKAVQELRDDGFIDILQKKWFGRVCN